MLKFRVWDKEKKQWRDNDDIYIDQDGEILLIEERSRSYQSYMHKEYLNGKVEIVRCTGLKDGNGKEVWQGDLLQSDWRQMQVFWDAGGFCIKDQTGSEWLIQDYSLEACEVIGNIYEGESHAAGA